MILRIEDLFVSYGAIRALNGVTFDVQQSEITALIGSNGAGKTTTLNAICGLVPITSGSIVFKDESIGGLLPNRIVRKGLVQVPEGRKVFTNLTVHECLLMGTVPRQDRAQAATDINRMYEVFPRLAERRTQLSGTLSGGEQQMLAFARALVAKPTLLLLDEPSMGLAPQIVDNIIDHILRIREDGVTVLLVEQNAEMALSICDSGYVLERGDIVLSGTGSDLLENKRIRSVYLGI